MPMNFGAIFLSFILPMQAQTISMNKEVACSCWAINVAIDSARLLGLANMRSKVVAYNPDPELFLRLPEKEDRPKNRRKQFIENYVNNTSLLTTR